MDPATLALFPLRTRPLAAGLLAASATGAWPLANLLGLLGITVGLARGASGLITALLAVPLQLLFCITLARLVTTGLAGLLRSRRGKDLAVLLILPVFAGYEAFIQTVPRLGAQGKVTAASFAGFDAWTRWLPPGLAAHAVEDASSGHPGTAALRLLLLAAVIAALGLLWIRALNRALVSADTATRAAAVHRAGLPFARHGLRGTLAARLWIYQRREPRALIFWGMIAVIMAVSCVSTVRTPQYLSGLLASAGFGGAFVGAFNVNAIGTSGPAFVLEAMVLTGRRGLRAYFAAQSLVLAAIAAPLLTLVCFVLAAVSGHPAAGLLSTATALAGVGAGLALSQIFTVVEPYPVERRAGSPTPRPADGYGGHAFGGIFGSILGTAVAIGPVIAAIVLTRADPAPVRMPVLLLCAAGYGVMLAWAGVRVAARTAEQNMPELYQVAAHSKL